MREISEPTLIEMDEYPNLDLTLRYIIVVH